MHTYYIIALLALAMSLLLLWLCRRQRLLALRARLMREALHNRDFTFRLPVGSRLPGERALQAALNDTLAEVGRLMARSEVESWQRLTRVLTHEIMNSIAPIQSIAQAYIDSGMVKDTPLEEGIRAIHDTSLSLSAFVDSYRKLTQLQTPNMTDVRLLHIADNLRQLYPDICWHVDVPTDATARADAGMVHQVAVNIAKNAHEAGAANIGVRLDRSGDYVRLFVSNDGEPITPDVAREIFVPFFTTKKTGSGIGLPLARQMMMSQGGDLLLADTPQPGYHTTFIIIMMACQD